MKRKLVLILMCTIGVVSITGCESNDNKLPVESIVESQSEFKSLLSSEIDVEESSVEESIVEESSEIENQSGVETDSDIVFKPSQYNIHDIVDCYSAMILDSNIDEILRFYDKSPFIYATNCDSFAISKTPSYINQSVIQKGKEVEGGNVHITTLGHSNGLDFYCIDMLESDENYYISSWNDDISRDINNRLDILINPYDIDTSSFVSMVELAPNDEKSSNGKVIFSSDGSIETDMSTNLPRTQYLSTGSILAGEYYYTATGIGSGFNSCFIDGVYHVSSVYGGANNINVVIHDTVCYDKVFDSTVKDTLGFAVYEDNGDFSVGNYDVSVKPYGGREECNEDVLLPYSFHNMAYECSKNFSSVSEQCEAFSGKRFMAYDEYEDFCAQWGIAKYFTDDTSKYAIYSEMFSGDMTYDVTGVSYIGSTVYINTESGNWCAVGGQKGIVVVVPVTDTYDTIEVKNKDITYKDWLDYN